MGKKRKTARPKLHPFIEAYISCSGTTSDLLRQFSNRGNPLFAALQSLYEAMFGQRSAEEALLKAECVDLSKEDPNLSILFLRFWSTVSISINRLAEAQALYHRAKSFLSEDTPVELQALVIKIEGSLAGTRGNNVQREENFKCILKMLEDGSPRYWDNFYDYAMVLTRYGRGSEIKGELERLTVQPGAIRKYRDILLILVRFFNFVETGRTEEAMGLFSEIEWETDLAEYYRHSLAVYRNAIDLMLDRWELDSKNDSNGKTGSEKPAWAISIYHLLRNDAAEALRWARKSVSRESEHFHWIGFTKFTLIRAELSAGNGAAAKRLLEHRHSQGGDHYLDDFFLARIELLAGNREKAAYHFLKVRKSVERYDAEPRLEFEMKLACELSPGDIMRLADGSDRPAEIQAAARTTVSSEPKVPSVGIDRLIGKSRAIAKIRETIMQVGPLDVPILITGETGTGKELVARALHEAGPRKDEPFLAINCGAITESLLQSELFGHTKGAFTGAEKAHNGIFKEAGDGTVFLDEISGISPQLQVALLRVLETGEFRPVGSARARKYSCRVVASTNAPLEELVGEDRFRKDLFYRLRRMEITTQPLRERSEDILTLAVHFLNEGRPKGSEACMTPELEDALKNHEWPGNVRELRNEIERMRLLNSDKLFYHAKDLVLNQTEETKSPKPGVPLDVIEAPELEPAESKPPEEKASKAIQFQAKSEKEIDNILRQSSGPLRRREFLRELFEKYRKLTRVEITKIMDITNEMATRDLKALMQEGFIEKVKPTASSRSNYFVLCAQSSDHIPQDPATVREAGDEMEESGLKINDAANAIGDPSNDTANDTADAANVTPCERQEWILDELRKGTELRVVAVTNHFKCSTVTAKRDFAALRKKGLVHFVGPTKTGFYRLKK